MTNEFHKTFVQEAFFNTFKDLTLSNKKREELRKVSENTPLLPRRGTGRASYLFSPMRSSSKLRLEVYY
jgi:hypothetical protein